MLVGEEVAVGEVEQALSSNRPPCTLPLKSVDGVSSYSGKRLLQKCILLLVIPAHLFIRIVSGKDARMKTSSQVSLLFCCVSPT